MNENRIKVLKSKKKNKSKMF